MKLSGFRTICCSLLLLSWSLCVGHAATNVLYVPEDALTKFGGGWSDVLFFRSYGEQIYSSNAFSKASADLIWITEIAFRAEETYANIDAWFERLSVHLTVWPGSMEEAVSRRSGVVEPVILAYNGTNVQLNARSGLLGAFDAVFPITPPFRYDRRTGQLVLFISRGQRYGIGSGAGFDLSYPVGNYDLGAHFYPYPGNTGVIDAVFTTRFTFLYSSAEIHTLTASNGELRLDFSTSGRAAAISIETAEKITGHFSKATAEIVQIEEGRFSGSVPISGTNRFYRILLTD